MPTAVFSGFESKMAKATKIKFPCGNCNKTTSGSAALQCSICELWHHRECVPGMTKEAYQQLLSMKETMGYSFFLCGKCEKVHKKVWQAVNNLGKRVDSVETRLEKVEKLLEKYGEEQEETNRKVESVKNKSVSSAADVQTTVITEMQEQENRKTNIVIYNLNESQAEDGADRKNHDLSEIGSLLQQIQLPVSVKEDIAAVRRLGKIPEPDSEPPLAVPAKPRPMLVSFKTPSSRRSILSNAKKLSNSPLAHISICPDLTKNQQIEDRKLRNDVKKLNAENPSDDKGAFLWKAVGVPGQQNRRKVKIYQQNPNATL